MRLSYFWVDSGKLLVKSLYSTGKELRHRGKINMKRVERSIFIAVIVPGEFPLLGAVTHVNITKESKQAL